MVGFVTYDLIFLAAFIVFVVVFLSTRKKNLERQGIMYLYKTQWGVKFIDWFAKKFNGVLKPLQYVVMFSGYALMAGIIWLIGKSTYLYLTTSIAQIIRAPPIFPVIPYFPKIFGLESLFPPLYFTYFIVALGIIAVFHEAAHGIYARFYKLKVQSTGFAFLGPILGAFVEPDEKQMAKAAKFKQMVILAAGTFANVIMALLFSIVMALFFTSVFVPAGVKFNNYGLAEVNVADLGFMGNSSIDGFVELQSDGETYFLENAYWDLTMENDLEKIVVYEDTPAFRSQMRGAITQIDDVKVTNIEDLRYSLDQHNPGDEVTVRTAVLEAGKGTVAENREYTFNLTENSEGGAALGIVFMSNDNGGLFGLFYKVFSEIKDPFTHYESKIGDFGWFVYYLLWWIIVLNFLVALFNMLPLGILDGGRFFYLTIWGITGREKWGAKAYKWITWFIVALFVIMMLKWALTLF
ncbi:MAG: site-2 protease family protein [archaeon]